MKNKEIFSKFYSDLRCKIYILGEPNEGESILFILYGDNVAIYSCIVDSFKDGDEIAISGILKECCVDTITDLIWTHPHDDHSDGIIEIIEKYHPEHVYIPSNLHNLSENVGEISRNVLKRINEYKSYDNRCSYQPKIDGVGINRTLKDGEFSVGTNKIRFSIYSLAPCSGKTRRKAITGNEHRLNDYSIVIMIVVGDFAILLTGDVQDEMVDIIDEETVLDIVSPNLLKIPHHGSKYSTQILSLFKDKRGIDKGIVTRKSSSKLPKREALDFYAQYMDDLYKIDDNATSLAIWGAEIDILQATVRKFKCENFLRHI